MDIVTKEAVVDVLTFLVNGGKPDTAHAGICLVVQNTISDACLPQAYIKNLNEWQAICAATYKDWNKWTNSVHYPVPLNATDYSVIEAREAFDDGTDKWDRETEYGLNRLELVQLLLDAVIDSETTHDHIHSSHCPCTD